MNSSFNAWVRLLRSVAGVLVVALVAGLAPAAAATPRQPELIQLVATKVGGAVRDVGQPERRGAFTAQPAIADGHQVRTLTTSGRADFSLVALIDRPTGGIRFPGLIPPHSTLHRVDGGFLVQRAGVVIGQVHAPWAIDARGRSLPTRYDVGPEGDLVQQVDTRGAAFPVAADPRITFGWGIYLNGYGYEWRALATVLIGTGTGVVLAGCTVSGRVPGAWRAALVLLCGTLGVTNLVKTLRWLRRELRAAMSRFRPSSCYQINIVRVKQFKAVRSKGNCRA